MKLALSVPPTAEMLSSVRHTVLDWLAGAGYRGEGAHDVLVVVSELVTNGVIHDGGDDIELYLTKDDNGISIEVVTIGQKSVREARQFRGVTGMAESGRGLIVVDALTDVLSIEDNRGRHHVICHVAIEEQVGTAMPVLSG
jgi:anti-sigma regulatory factor (Ser/Thr protein kinase)